MQPAEHGDLAAERGDVVARVLGSDTGVEDALALLDDAEALVSVPLVDESERARLTELSEGRRERSPHWHSLLARRHGVPVGYAGLLLPVAAGGTATGDLAVRRDRPPTEPVLAALLAGMEGLSWRHQAGRLEIWLRASRVEDVACVSDEGYGIVRRLAVMGRDLTGLSAPAPVPERLSIRPYEPDRDDAGIVAVLAAAYAGTPDEGWDLGRFRDRRDYDWFDPDDLLVAVSPEGEVAGIHWTKRRSAAVGEVYNLAIGPDAQGIGLGAALLDAGLAHLAGRGLDEVVLWVDLSNERAVRLYAGHGFHTRWEDLALARTLRG